MAEQPTFNTFYEDDVPTLLFHEVESCELPADYAAALATEHASAPPNAKSTVSTQSAF